MQRPLEDSWAFQNMDDYINYYMMMDYVIMDDCYKASMGFAELYTFKPPKLHRPLHSVSLKGFTCSLTMIVGYVGCGSLEAPSVLFLATNHPL